MAEARLVVVFRPRREANSDVLNPRGGYVVRSYPLPGGYRSAEAVMSLLDRLNLGDRGWEQE
jgi:hypothetical protein